MDIDNDTINEELSLAEATGSSSSVDPYFQLPLYNHRSRKIRKGQFNGLKMFGVDGFKHATKKIQSFLELRLITRFSKCPG